MSSTSCRSQCGSGSSRSSSFFTEDQPLRYPFYPYVDHPLVYYAQVPESRGFKQRIRDKKDNPNCFVRAFRWYTQEHNVQRSSANAKVADTAGFASWLDHKYDQFLNDSCQNSVQVSRQLVTSSIQIATNRPCKLRTDKYKKPWGRLRATSRRNGGDCHPGKRNQSFEIILQPKDLSHPASECCFQNRQDPCCETRATGISSDTEVMSRNSKLQNYATVVEGKDLRVLPVPENSKIRRFPVDETVVLTRTLNSASSLNNKKHDNVSCQCPEDYAGTADASTQYDLNDLECVPPTWEQPVKTEQPTTPEVQSFPTKGCKCQDQPVVKNGIGTQCFQEECTKMLMLNNSKETKTTIDQGKATASSLLQNPELKSSEAVNSQRRKMYVCECLGMEMYSSTQYSQSKFKITDCNRCKACIKDHEHDTESKAGLQEEKIRSNEIMNTLQPQAVRKVSVADQSLKLATCCKIQPELKSGECDACKICPLNRDAEAITTHSENKVTTLTLSEQPKVTSNQRLSMQPPNVNIHSSNQLTISQSKTSEFDVCQPYRLNSKITDTKITYTRKNEIESSMCQQARAKCNEKMNTQRPSLKTSVICACPKDDNFVIIQQSQPESKIPECKVCKLNKHKEKIFCDREKVKSTEKAEMEKPQSHSETSTVCPAIKVTSESRHLQPESKCDVCKTCKVSDVIETKTYNQEKTKSNQKMDTLPSLKTSVICACPKANNFGIIQQSQPESQIPECKICKLNKNIVKTFCDQEKVIKEWKPVANSVDIMCNCPKTNKEANQSRKASKSIPTRQATAQTSDYSICLGKILPGGFPLLVQVMAKR